MALTKSDFNQLSSLLDKKLTEQTVKFGSIVEDVEEKFENKLTEFKSDFFNKIDPVLKEVTTAQEERPLIESRLEALEEIHPEGKHVVTS